jgi:hypothetical protein
MLKILYSYITEVLGYILMVFLFAAFTMALFDCL